MHIHEALQEKMRGGVNWQKSNQQTPKTAALSFRQKVHREKDGIHSAKTY